LTGRRFGGMRRLRRDKLWGIMIELYTWITPNGQKVSIMLEEVAFLTACTPSTSPKASSSRRPFSKYRPTTKSPPSSTPKSCGQRQGA
jgi:hypothetical protein